MRLIVGAILTMAMLVTAVPGQEKQPADSPQAAQFFETKVRPVLAEHCFKCHGDVKKPKADLRLDSRRHADGRRPGAGHRAGRARQEPAHQGDPLR